MTHLRGSRAAYYQLRFDVRRTRTDYRASSKGLLPHGRSLRLPLLERRPLNPGLAIFLVFFVLPGLAEFLAEVLT